MDGYDFAGPDMYSDYSSYNPDDYSFLDYGGYGGDASDLSGYYGDYSDYGDYGYQEPMAGSGMAYNVAPEDDYRFLDYGNYVNPEAELVAQGAYTPPAEREEPGILGTIGGKIKSKWERDPLGVIAGLGTFGANLYSSMQENKQREAMAREIRDAKAAREAKLARYGAVLPMKLNRQQLAPPPDLLTAGQRTGGINWFTPATFTNMADGGAVRDKRGVLSRLLGPSLLPDIPVGPRNPMEALALKKYALYKMQQEENQEPYIDYGRWTDRGMRGMAEGGGLSSLIEGDGGGQEDNVPINASAGEYVIDADAVSAIGDGNNAEGARRLDAMVQNLRAHKRSAPNDSIPPSAREPESYLEEE
jgi:hypothetical protein